MPNHGRPHRVTTIVAKPSARPTTEPETRIGTRRLQASSRAARMSGSPGRATARANTALRKKAAAVIAAMTRMIGMRIGPRITLKSWPMDDVHLQVERHQPDPHRREDLHQRQPPVGDEQPEAVEQQRDRSDHEGERRERPARAAQPQDGLLDLRLVVLLDRPGEPADAGGDAMCTTVFARHAITVGDPGGDGSPDADEAALCAPARRVGQFFLMRHPRLLVLEAEVVAAMSAAVAALDMALESLAYSDALQRPDRRPARHRRSLRGRPPGADRGRPGQHACTGAAQAVGASVRGLLAGADRAELRGDRGPRAGPRDRPGRRSRHPADGGARRRGHPGQARAGA